MFNWLTKGLRTLSGGLAAPKAIAPDQLPAGGRSSLEPADNLSGAVSTLAYAYDQVPYSPTILMVLENLAVFSPVVSQAVKLMTNTVNCGHDLVIDGPKGKVAAAQELLAGLAPTIYRESAGVDGLINHYSRQLAVSGCIVSEDVLWPDLKGLKKVVVLPASVIRFKLLEGDWQIQQESGMGKIDLNQQTCAYYALDCIPGHPPYAVPPFLAAIDPEALQRDILKQLKQYAKKMGLYGIATIEVPPPSRLPGETEHEFMLRCQAYLDQAAAAYKVSYASGIMVMPGGDKGHKFEHKDVAKSSFAVKEVMQGVEQLLMSALNIDPAMFGRSFSTTETYAGVVYYLLLRSGAQYQRLIKRRIERTYRLALLLAGLHQCSVSLVWRPQPELDKQKAAEAEQTRTETVLSKARAGIISPDQAAQELGYDEAFDPELLSAGQQAEAGLARVALAGDGRGGYRRPDLGRLADDPVDAAENAITATSEAWVEKYLAKVRGLTGPVREQALAAVEELLAASPELGQEEFAAAVLKRLAAGYAEAWQAAEAVAEVARAIEPVYRHFRLASDLSGAGRASWSWGGPEKRTLDFAGKLDSHYFGTYLDNADAQSAAMRVLREEWLDKGAGLFGRADPEAIAKFRAALENELRLLDDTQIQRIVDTTVMRLRNWANVQQLAEAGAVWAQVWAILDGATSAICREMHGRKFKVADLAAEVDRLSAMSAKDFEAHLRGGYQPGAQAVRTGGQGPLVAAGKAAPPYHPRCRTRLKMALSPPVEAPPAPEGATEDQQRAWDYWHGLPEEARAKRLEDAARAEWTRPTRLAKHAERHRELGDTSEAYQKQVKAVLANPQSVLVKLSGSGELEIGLKSGGKNDWKLAVIDPDSDLAWAKHGAPALRTAYGPKPERPVSWDRRKAGLAGQGWVEVKK